MSPSEPTTTSPDSSNPKIGPWAALLFGIVAFAAVYVGVQALRVALFSHLTVHGAREMVAWRAFTSIVLVWASLAAILFVARLRGQRMRDLGWRKPSSMWGWLAAIAVTVLYAGFTIMGSALKNAPLLTDWSLFRIVTAVSIGLSAGICEETIFRGFVMTQARDAGLGPVAQVLMSALLFGLAHVGWGGMTGKFALWPMVASMIATFVLGAMLAVTYLVARRSLSPVIAAHAATDMIIEPWLLLFMVGGGHF